MLDPTIVSLADRLFEDEERKRTKHLVASLDRLISDATRRGILGAGFFHSDLIHLYAEECRIRAELMWDVLQRVLAARGLPVGDLLSDILAYLVPRLDRLTDSLATKAQKELDRFAHGGIPWQQTVVAEEGANAKAGIVAKVELFAYEVAARRETAPNSLVQNFYGTSTIGAIQTGHGSTASVHQSVTVGDPAATARALDELSAAVRASVGLAQEAQHEVLLTIDELRSEILRPEPRRMSLMKLAGGIALAVQTSADLKPAYDIVRGVMLAWGVTLPVWQ